MDHPIGNDNKMHRLLSADRLNICKLLRSDPSSMGHVESRVNQQGPPCKAKYSWVTDSEVVP
ncbi:hypothetical protein HN51_035916 [Arachis hypogaea]